MNLALEAGLMKWPNWSAKLGLISAFSSEDLGKTQSLTNLLRAKIGDYP
ncbi:MAG: hypothetical protein ACYST5_04200 [Planctomycetota bacterium]